MQRRHEGDVTKLPKWAQSKIRVLEMRLREAQEALAYGPEDSTTWLDPYSTTPRPFGDATVSFKVDGGDIRCRVERGNLDVLVVGHQATIRPLSGNHFEVRAK